MSGGPWIGPTVEETITKLKDAGNSRVLIQPVGFVCDHVEVLYDIDIAFRAFGSGIGVDVVRTESLNDSPAFIAALADLVMRRGRANTKVTRATTEVTKDAV
jgi:ferrochelatase